MDAEFVWIDHDVEVSVPPRLVGENVVPLKRGEQGRGRRKDQRYCTFDFDISIS